MRKNALIVVECENCSEPNDKEDDHDEDDRS